MRPGTLVVLEPGGGPTVSPTEGMVLWFGRNRPDVHICVGPDDAGVSRRHGTLEYSAGCWWVRTLGGRPVRVGGTQVLRRGTSRCRWPTAAPRCSWRARTPATCTSCACSVVGAAEQPPRAGRARARCPSAASGWTPSERLVHDRRSPSGSSCVLPAATPSRPPGEAAEAARGPPARGGWTPKKVEHLVKRVRERLAGAGRRRARARARAHRLRQRVPAQPHRRPRRLGHPRRPDLRLLGLDDG